MQKPYVCSETRPRFTYVHNIPRLSGVVLSFMYPISKDPRLWGLFQYTKEVVIEFGRWTRYVVNISVMFATVRMIYLVSSSLLCTLFLRTHARVWRLFQYTKEVVVEFLHWTRYAHVHVHVVYVSVIVCYCTDGLSGVVLSFMYYISKDPCKSVETFLVHQRSCDWVS